MIRELLSRVGNRTSQARTCLVIAFLFTILLLFNFIEVNHDLCVPAGGATAPPCHESIYSFPCWNRSQSFLEDRDLLERCQIFGTRHASKPPTSEATPMVDESYMITKCGTSRLQLVSFTRKSKDDQTKYPQGTKVPNVVHYVALGCSIPFSFINFVSFFSAHKFIKPRKIIVHGDCVPSGIWWDLVTKTIPDVYFSYRERPKLIQGRRPGWIEHEADILRLQILYDNGGIYLDLDVLVLKPFSPLYEHETVLGRVREKGISNGVILAAPRSPFICVWLNSYREYFDNMWDRESVLGPHNIALKFPHFVHVEADSMMRPNDDQAWSQMHNGNYDWSKNYCIHIWSRLWFVRLPKVPRDIFTSNTLVGETIRFILYDSKAKIYNRRAV